jgi:Domain of unknown function (DUF1707)/Cell wall-active antibiotics response 4TMS YvqF
MESGAVRASDAERDATVERLRDAAAEGRLTLEELADRIEAASRAVTRGELTLLLSDLPAPLPAIQADVAPVRALGDVKRSGAWVVPAQSRYRSWMGHIKLDLREARISGPEVHIHAWALFGTIDLLVPEGVEVDVQAHAKLGQLKQETGIATPGAPRIVLTGGTVFGEVKVRHRRLWEKLAKKVLERG